MRARSRFVPLLMALALCSAIPAVSTAQRGLGGLRGRGAGLMAAAQDASLLGVILTHKDDLKLSAEQVATMRRIDSTTTAANAGDSQMASRLGASRSKRIPRPHHHAPHAIAPTSISPVPETPVNDPWRSAPPRTKRRSSVARSCRRPAGIRIWGSGVRSGPFPITVRFGAPSGA